MAAGLVLQPPDSVVLLLGEQVEISGKIDRKKHTVLADKILLQEVLPRDVEGEGVVEASVPLKGDSPGSRVVRVGGYSVVVKAQTTKDFRAPLDATSPIEVNMWMTFHGRQQSDGVVEADKISVDSNGIGKREEKLLKHSDYDPGAVDKDAKQSTLSKVFRGIDPKQIPPYDDPVLQARVESIGNKLIPLCQRNLSQDEGRKIDFQFQVIDLKRWRRDAHALPNGIILVPLQVTERMQNDSQLAAILADSIAVALEKQDYRAQPGATRLSGITLAGDAVGLVIPGLSLLTSGGVAAAEAKAQRLREEESGRVSLFLLNDAGYDIDEAPVAWWLLASNKPKAIADIPLPRRAAYLYETLARSWRGK